MITLKQAIQVTKLEDDEICYLRKVESPSMLDSKLVTVKEIRNKYDMKKTKVIGLKPKFALDGDYRGIEFEIR